MLLWLGNASAVGNLGTKRLAASRAADRSGRYRNRGVSRPSRTRSLTHVGRAPEKTRPLPIVALAATAPTIVTGKAIAARSTGTPAAGARPSWPAAWTAPPTGRYFASCAT